MTKYEEVVFLSGDDDTDEFFALLAGDLDNEVWLGDDASALAYVRQWDYGDDAPESLDREQVERILGIGWSSFEDDYGFVAYHWDHNWVHYFRKVNER